MILTSLQESEGETPTEEGMATTAEELLTKSDSNGMPEYLDDKNSPAKDSRKLPGARRKPEKSRIVRVWQNDDGSDLMCPNCFSEVLSEEELETHLNSCRRSGHSSGKYVEDGSNPFFKYRMESSPEPNETSTFKVNSSFISEMPQEESSSGGYAHVIKMLRQAVPQMNNSQQLALEVLLNAQMSLSRIATSNGSQENGHSSSEGRENPVSFQHQQLLQLHLIQLLQAQLTVNGEKTSEADTARRNENNNDESVPGLVKSFAMRDGRRDPSPVCEPLDSADNMMAGNSNSDSTRTSVSEVEPVSSPSALKHISSQVIQHPDSPPSGGPNTLEMLQKTADEVLNNASKGLLASRLIDSCREEDSADPSRRHRCRFCGKVFSSDSGLQIHIRSHTGERPFKCNVCGNRFTTKGNLKVHFQRHTDQFPNIKMNPHPVPEHLDKFYPPLLPANSESLGEVPALPSTSPTAIPASPLKPVSSPTFKPIGLRHPPPLNVNFNCIGDSFLKPPSSDGMGRDLPNNFLDFRLFPPFLVPPQHLNKSEETTPDNKGKYDDLNKDSNLSPINDESIIGSENVKEETKDDETSQPQRENMMNASYQESFKNFQMLLAKNHIHGQQMNSLNFMRSESMISDGKNICKDIAKLKENSDLPEDYSINHHQPLNLKAKDKLERETLVEEHEKEEEKKSTRDDQDPYLSDSSTGTADKVSKHSLSPVSSPMEFSHMPFLGMHIHPNLALLHRLQQFPFPGPPPTSQPYGHSLDPSKVPHIYNDLLPRPGSTDNSWEALIEVTKADEHSKIEQLIIKQKDPKVTEPNQCAICHRVLSCKSALQMHYRIHTGERPFKCKICCRSFTTKGNLKTHMSVHRAKPPMRMLQQCPICHKKFSNALILQQHIKLHTGEPTDLSPEQIYAAEVRDITMDLPLPMRFPPLGPGRIPPHLQTRGPFSPPQHLPLPFYPFQKLQRKDDCEGKYGSPFSSSPRSSSTSSAEQHSAEDLSLRVRDDDNISESRDLAMSPTLSDYSDNEDKIQDAQKNFNKPPQNIPKEPQYNIAGDSSLFNNIGESPSVSLGFGLPTTGSFHTAPNDSSVKPSVFPFFPPLGLFSPMNPSGNPVQGLGLPGIVPLPEGNTTCKICFKIFACQSALEIHLRSHTKERPFRCSVCDRGFSTKGNLKQHTATHRQKDGSLDSNSMDNVCSPPSAEALSGGEASSDNAISVTSPEEQPLSEDDMALAGASPKEEDKSDSGMKREREGELSLPDPKRSLGIPEKEDISTSESTAADTEGKDGRMRSPLKLPAAYFQSSISQTPTSIPFPASVVIPHGPLPGLSSVPYVNHNSTHQLSLPVSLPLPLPSSLSAPKSN